MEKKEKLPTDRVGSTKEQPVIEIYKDGERFTVKVNGKEIERLRSFEVKVSNERKTGIREAAFYQLEQYFPCTHSIVETETIKDIL